MIRRMDRSVWQGMTPLARYSGLRPGDRVVLCWTAAIRTGRRGRPRLEKMEEEILITRELLEEMKP